MTDVIVGKSRNNNIKYSYIAGFLDDDGAVSAIIERHPEKKFSIVKKKQIKLALKILRSEVKSKKDLIKNAKIADILCGFNVRSRSIRKNDSSIII